jgi:biopolymer transport protein ExbD
MKKILIFCCGIAVLFLAYGVFMTIEVKSLQGRVAEIQSAHALDVKAEISEIDELKSQVASLDTRLAHVYDPKVVMGPARPAKTEMAVTIRVISKSEVEINGQSEPITQLADFASSLAQTQPMTIVHITAPGNTNYGTLKDVWNACRIAGISRITLQTEALQ